ncbi:MAG: hypothetical protein AB1765_04615, partial [Candidatus Hydrogenedentota bacterium]
MPETYLLTEKIPKRVFLVGCRLPKSNLNDLSISIVELESLAKSVGNIVVGSKLFNLKEINPATFIGYG